MKRTATVTSKGQITIPLNVRKALRLEAGDRVVFDIDESGASKAAKIERAPDFFALAGSIPPIRKGLGSAEQRRIAREDLAARQP